MLAAGATPRPSKSPTVEQHILGAQDLISRGELEAAKDRVEVALKEHPKAGGLYNLLGIIDAKENKLSSAANFERAIRLDPQLAGTHLNLGRAQVLAIDGDPAAARRAEANFRRLLFFQSEQAEARFQLAKLLEWRGAFEESLQ
jgi:cytochrome c-type biogenesis protein CcmH/NrfG